MAIADSLASAGDGALAIVPVGAADGAGAADLVPSSVSFTLPPPPKDLSDDAAARSCFGLVSIIVLFVVENLFANRFD